MNMITELTADQLLEVLTQANQTAGPVESIVIQGLIEDAASLRARIYALSNAMKSANVADDCQHVDPASELARIASKHLGFPVLESRNMDSLDFKDCGVLAVRDALQAAYEAGRNA